MLAPEKGAAPEPFGSIGLIEGSGAGWLLWICPPQRMAAASEQPPHMSNNQSKCRTTSFRVYRRRYDARGCATTDLLPALPLCVMAWRTDQDLARVLLGDRHLECLIKVYLGDIFSTIPIEANLVETQGGNPFPLRHLLDLLPN